MKFTLAKTGIALVFLIASIDAYQDLWSPTKVSIKMTFFIFLVAIFSALPGYFAYIVSKKSKVPTKVINVYWIATYALIIISLVIWTFGVLGGASPAEGASHMHLMFWPIIIGIMALIMYVLCIIFNNIISYFKPYNEFVRDAGEKPPTSRS